MSATSLVGTLKRHQQAIAVAPGGLEWAEAAIAIFLADRLGRSCAVVQILRRVPRWPALLGVPGRRHDQKPRGRGPTVPALCRFRCMSALPAHGRRPRWPAATFSPGEIAALN